MLNIGLDFGTTTSILSYCDERQSIESFRMGGAAGTPYIPSVLSIAKEDGDSQIGNDARLNLGDDDYDVYSHFKMLLAEQDNIILDQRGYSKIKPHHVAQKYISSLIESYLKEHKLGKSFNKLVITVPEIWVREGRHAAREKLKNICMTLGFPYRLISEPVAACVYFVNRFKAKYKRDYNGYVVVFDYGGGTLDLSLSKVENNKIQIIEGSGTGKGNAIGTAGVAFDEAVIKKFLKEKKYEKKHFYDLLKKFEDHKINQSSKITKALSLYRQNPATSKKIFEITGIGDIGNIIVTPKDLIEVFDDLIKKELHKALTEINDYLKKNNVNTENAENFRVVMVGGFSAFYPVQYEVKKFFGSKTDADSRFESCFDLTDTALAISKGAALIANGHYDITLTCPISVGINVKQLLEPVDIVCLEKGKNLSNYIEPKFNKMKLQVLSPNSFDNDPIKIFLDIGRGKRRYLNLVGKLKDFLPNPNINNEWQIGFSVDDDLVFTLHIRDKEGKMQNIQLGNLEEKIGGLHIKEE